MNSRLQPDGSAEADAELERYLETRFTSDGNDVEIPVPDEPCSVWWAERARDEEHRGAFALLAAYVPRLWFPVAPGMSDDPAYRAAVLRGVARDAVPEAVGLPCERPDQLAFEVYPSFAGRIPVITVHHRPDFVLLVQALANRNEPVAVPASQGAAMVAGLPNWERIRELERRWEAGEPGMPAATTWAEAWRSLVAKKELYQDRFVVLSDGPYSGVPAPELDLSEAHWRRLSLSIRREHECTHYFTRRVFGSMRNHLLDELIADYVGMVAAVGRFRADWFLRFLGLRGATADAGGRRIEIYRGDPPLSDPAFERLQDLVEVAAGRLEAFDRERWPDGEGGLERRALMVQALCRLRLDDLAASDAASVLGRALSEVRPVGPPGPVRASA